MHYEIEYALGAQANSETGSIGTEAATPAEAVGQALEQLSARGISPSHVFRIAIKKTGRSWTGPNQ
jgi:hypothetical protein